MKARRFRTYQELIQLETFEERFDYLNLNNIMLNVYSFNENAISCYRKVGFKEFGRRREAIMKKNERYDIIYMDIIREEYYKE